MTIHFDLPASVEEALSRGGGDPSRLVLEAALLELYRREQITHHELGQGLGLNRFETDGFLKRHGVPMALTIEELREQVASLRTTVDR